MSSGQQKFVKRFLQAKRFRFRWGRQKKDAPLKVTPSIESLLLQIKSAAPHWAQRHFPKPAALGGTTIQPGSLCAFIEKIEPRTSGDLKGVYFEIAAYTFGQAHEQFELDFAAPEPPTSSEQLPASGGGNPRAIMNRIRGVALGETVILESSRGSGGYGVAEKLIGRMIQLLCPPPPPLPAKPGEQPKPAAWPNIELMDVASNDLTKEIERGGGVSKIYLRLVNGGSDDADSWAYALRQQKDKIPHAAKFHAVWEAIDDAEALDTGVVMGAVNEYMDDDSQLDKMTLELVNHHKIVSLGKYKVREEIDVLIDSAGVIHGSYIVNGLWAFLDKLRTPDSSQWRLIDDDGKFISNEAVTVPTSS